MIEVNRVSKSYGDVMAVHQVSFEAPAAGSLVVLGPSGSGKTTLLRLIAGLEIPDEGEIRIEGRVASRAGWALAPQDRGLGFVFQSSALWPHMTVAQNILFGLHSVPRSEARRRLQELLESMDLKGLAGRYPHQISTGEARRVALARSLAPRPSYLLMDEPLTNLDADLKERLLSLIVETAGQNQGGLIYVTHDTDEASRIGERVLVLEDGHLETDGDQADEA